MSADPPADTRRRNETSRRAILTAALDLCEQVGYGATTVEAIASRAGASKKTIYRWWPSKGAVVLEAVTDLAPAETPFPHNADVAADLHEQMNAVLAFLGSPRAGSAYTGLIAETQHDPQLAEALVTQLIRPRVQAAVDRLDAARQAGELSEHADLRLAVEMLYGPIYYRHLLHLGRPSPEHLRNLIEQVIAPLRPQSRGRG
ncbi:TetR family transcriptional regulator [Catellatospora sp. IY07-71]|uniref:TetR/AcrR family transcriptional regulator n=1 Tax=Catellatospora sp. IY07-71 TaxID=2728827 RepID=UPI001BB32367|nr:TetR/AcrR family transcriptional regulator [Catellatospora sp. IY07-71]BCJ75360.1 TetR family transcriptional regulator [Catellatospora sp. IY07-71]